METLSKLFPVTALNDQSHIYIAGHSIEELAKEWGTPLYLYDGETVRQQVDRLQGYLSSCYPGSTEVTYSAKAYFSLPMAKKLAEMNVGVDVVSLGEMKLAHWAGMKADRVHVHGNNKSEEELGFAVDWGVQAIVVDSLDELQLLEMISERKHKTPRIWLRITPEVNVHTHTYIQTGHSESKFGLPIHDGQAAEAISKAMNSPYLKLTGLHMHIGSQLFEADPFKTAIQHLLDLAEGVGFIPEELSPGGGWGVPYTLNDSEEDASVWTTGVCSALQLECEKRGWPLPKVILEPGRWLVARAGVAVYSVGSTKFSGDGKYIIAVDGGMADNPRVPLYQAVYTALIVNRPEAPNELRSAVVGKFCESGDQLIEEILLPKAKRGELLAMPSAGAYQISMSSNYNMASRPPVLWLEKGKIDALQIRERPEEGGYFTGE